MPPKAKKNVLVMITNVGSTSSDQNSVEEEPFLDKAKYAMRLLVEKKIFLQPKDEIGIITMGDESDNPDDVDYVKIYSEHLLVANWEMVKFINGLTSTDYVGNWIEALNVAISFIKREVLDPTSQIFIVIFNNFKEDSESILQYDPSIIINDLENYNNLRILFVGENPLEQKVYRKDFASISEKFALTIVKKAGAQYEKMNKFIDSRRFYIPPPTQASPWKINLDYNGVQIPCSTYVQIKNTSKLGSWSLEQINDTDDLSGNSSKSKSSLVKEKIMLDLHSNIIREENIINGYTFGRAHIPFSPQDEAAMKYKESRKGLMIYGFVPQNEVKLEYWSGAGSRIIVPQTTKDAPAFYSFVKAMVDEKYVAIVRKVYSDGNLPKMGVLFPKMDDHEIRCLIHLELPFVDEVRTICKKPIKSLEKIIDEEKLEALNNYIDSMTISESDKEPDYLCPGMFPNVRNQYHWNAIADRAIHPEQPLLPLNDYLQKYLVPPEFLFERTKPYLEKLDKLFPSWKVNKTERYKQQKEAERKVKLEAEKITKQESKDSSKATKNITDEAVSFVEDVDVNMEELDEL